MAPSTSPHGRAVFDTAIGWCGVAWSPEGVIAVQLPEMSELATRTRLAQRTPELDDAAPPPTVQRAIDAMTGLLRGEPVDLAAIALDLATVPAFDRSVYSATREIPTGATRTYGAIAAQLGIPGGARAVGQALGRNPVPIVVPCHRVLAAGQRAGGFSAHGGAATKLRMLRIEGASAPRLPGFD